MATTQTHSSSNGNDTAATTTVELPLDRLVVDRCNPRTDDPGRIDELGASIRDLGVLQPLLVRENRDGRYGVVCGSRRLAAARHVGLATVPCIVRQLDDVQALIAGGADNLARADMNPIEEARLYRDLIGRTGLAQDQLADRLGISQPKLSQRLKLLDLPPHVQRQVADGTMAVSAAYKLAKKDRGALSRPRRRAHAVVAEDVPDEPRNLGPRRTIVVPVGFWPVALPADVATAVRSCARVAGQRPEAWLVTAIREHARRQTQRGQR